MAVAALVLTTSTVLGSPSNRPQTYYAAPVSEKDALDGCSGTCSYNQAVLGSSGPTHRTVPVPWPGQS